MATRRAQGLAPLRCWRFCAVPFGISLSVLGVTVRDLADAFSAQASRVGARVLRTSRDEAVTVVGGALREAGCRTVALAESLPERETLVAALGGLGLELRS